MRKRERGKEKKRAESERERERREYPTRRAALASPLYAGSSPTSHLPPWHNGSNPRTGFLLHLSSAGRLDAAARCIGGFDTRPRSYFQNSEYTLSNSLSFSRSVSLFISFEQLLLLLFHRFSTVVPATPPRSPYQPSREFTVGSAHARE